MTTPAKNRFPHSLVLICAMIVLANAATHWLTPGEFMREPKPSAGSTFVDAEGAKSLRERLASARESRGLDPEQLGELFDVSTDTVRGWEVGDTADSLAVRGTHIEAGMGALLAAWIETGVAPTEEALDGWRAALANEKQRVVPGTYAPIEAAEVVQAEATTTWGRIKSWLLSIFEFIRDCLLPVSKGLESGGEIIFFVFVVGGVIGVLRATGAVDALIGASLKNLGGRPIVLIAGMVSLLALGASTIGMAEEYMPFIPILVTMCLALKLDAIVAMAIIYVGAGVGYGTAAYNPFTVLIAQDIAGLQATSGAWYRFLLMGVCLVVSVHHIARYARKIQADPSRSLVRGVDYTQGFEQPDDVRMTGRRLAILLCFGGGIALFVWGIEHHDWYFPELNAVFLGLAILAVVIGGIGVNRAASAFCSGAAEMTTTALLIGFARTIEVVLTDGQVIDTVVHGIASALDGAGASVAAVGMLGVQSICNLFIPSGSGQAYVTMPIMAPLADLTGVSRQTAVLAYQMGDGFTNMIVPTNALLMGMLGLARIPYQRWLTFVIPLVIKLYLIAVIAMVVGVQIGY